MWRTPTHRLRDTWLDDKISKLKHAVRLLYTLTDVNVDKFQKRLLYNIVEKIELYISVLSNMQCPLQWLYRWKTYTNSFKAIKRKFLNCLLILLVLALKVKRYIFTALLYLDVVIVHGFFFLPFIFSLFFINEWESWKVLRNFHLFFLY